MPRYADDRYDERDYAYERDYERDYDRDYRPPRRRDRRYDDERDYERDYERERVETVDVRAKPRAPSLVSERRAPVRQPDFLREDLDRPTAGALVVREEERDFERQAGKTNVSVVGSRRGDAPPPERVKEEIIIKERLRDDVSDSGRSRRSHARGPPREEVLIDERRAEIRAPARERLREVEEEDVVFRRDDRDRERERGWDRDYSPPPRRKEVVLDDRDILIRPPEPRPRREVEQYVFKDPREATTGQDLAIRERDRSPLRYDDDDIIVEERERDVEPPERFRGMAQVGREREEFVYRRRRAPSPRQRSPSSSPSPPRREIQRDEIVITQRERSRSPEVRARSPELGPISGALARRSPSEEPIYRQPIVQHVYHHHHYIDHGVEPARDVDPISRRMPPVPDPPTKTKDETVKIEIKREGIRDGEKVVEKDIIIERDHEVSGSKGSHKSSSDHGGRRRDSGRHAKRDMWTEVTKDLVIVEAIKQRGYRYREDDDHFYIIEYLEYDDVLRLVEISEDIRRGRRERARDIGWEEENLDRVSLTSGKGRVKYEEHERIIERDRVVDNRDTRSLRSARR